MKILKIKFTPNFLILSALFSILILIRIASDFNGLYGQDSYEYLRYSRRLAEFFTAGKPPGDYFWPVNFPLLGAILSLIIKDNIFALQLISMLSFVFTVYYTIRLVRLIFPNTEKEGYFYLLLFLVLSPFLFQSAFLVMSDMLAVFFTTAGIYYVLKYRSSHKRLDFFLAIFFSTLAVTTRYAAGVVLLIPGILLTIVFLKRLRFADFLSGLLIAALCLSPHFLIKGGNSEFLGHQWLQSWSVRNWFLSEFTTIDGYHNYRLPNLLYGFSHFYYPGFFFMGIVFIFFMQIKIFHRRENLVLFIPTVIYALFLAGIPFQNMRFLLLTFPLALILIFPAFERFRHKFLLKNQFLRSFAVCVILIQFVLIFKYSSGIYQTNRVEKKVAQTILSHSNRPIYTFAIDGALKCYGVESDDIVNMWYSKLDSVRVSALVLFNEERFKHQWQGRNPMINWQMIRNNYRLKKIESLPAGWELFQIEGRKE